MNRTQLSVLCLTALLVLAGCNTLPTTSSPTTSPHPTTSSSTTIALETTTTTPTPNTHPFRSNVSATHNTTVRDARGIRAVTTLNMTTTYESGTTALTGRKIFAVNFTTQRAIMSSAGGTAIQSTVYETPAARYKRIPNTSSTPNHPVYKKATPPYDTTSPAIQPVTRNALGIQWLQGINQSVYTQTRTTTWRTHEVTVYRGTGVEALPTTFRKFTVNATNTTANVTLLIDPAGIVRHTHIELTYTYNNATTHTVAMHNVTHVGPTPVTPPKWLPAAENATGD